MSDLHPDASRDWLLKARADDHHVSVTVVHRLVAALAFLLRLSPSFEGQLSSLLEVLQSRDTLKSKLEKGGCEENGVQKAEVRKLVVEVAEMLCL